METFWMIWNKKGTAPRVKHGLTVCNQEEADEKIPTFLRFIENLTVPSGKGEGKPFKLRPFQKRFIKDVYGPVDKSGNRIIRRAILAMGRKNGKSALIAAFRYLGRNS